MGTQKEKLLISLYFVWQWWDVHYQGIRGRCETIDLDWLDKTYQGRQQFLDENFGHLDLTTEIDGQNILSYVMPIQSMVVDAVLGMEIRLQDAGGYAWKQMPAEKLKELEPVDIADTPLADLIVRQRQEKLGHYGSAAPAIDLGSVSNNAFMLRGCEFYSDLLIDKQFAHHYLNVIKETMCMTYRFIHNTFGGVNSFALGNCNVTMMSPELYEEMICQYDIDCIEQAKKVAGTELCCNLHHCDVKTEPFARSYCKIPNLCSLQGSYHSNIRNILEALPGVKFSAMVNPAELLNRPIPEIISDIDKSLDEGANDIAIFNIDPACGPEMLKSLFNSIDEIAKKHNREAAFLAIPLSWEELAWEFPVYADHEIMT